MYNDTNKSALRSLRLPWMMASLQLGIGLLFIVPLWLLGLRTPPKLTMADLHSMILPALMHALGQMVTVASLGAGSIALVNAVKSIEPLSTAAASAILFGDVLPWQVNVCLLPIVAGVALASSADHQPFNRECCIYAMASNIFFSLRGVLSKRALTAFPAEKALDAANFLSVLTALAFLLTLPFALAFEGPKLGVEWHKAVTVGHQPPPPTTLLLRIILAGASFHLYNEASFHALNLVHPLTHAVGNAAKRPLLVLYSVVRGGALVRVPAAAGSALAVSGLILYALTKRVYAEPRRHDQ